MTPNCVRSVGEVTGSRKCSYVTAVTGASTCSASVPFLSLCLLVTGFAHIVPILHVYKVCVCSIAFCKAMWLFCVSAGVSLRTMLPPSHHVDNIDVCMYGFEGSVCMLLFMVLSYMGNGLTVLSTNFLWVSYLSMWLGGFLTMLRNNQMGNVIGSSLLMFLC